MSNAAVTSDTSMVEPIDHRPANDAPRKQIHDDREVEPALFGPDVCDVRDPRSVPLFGAEAEKLRFNRSGAIG